MTDLTFDPDEVMEDMTVLCRISDGPRHADPEFDPTVGDPVVVDDADQSPMPAVVLSRSDDVVIVKLLEPNPLLQHALRQVLWPCRRPGRGRCEHHRRFS